MSDYRDRDPVDAPRVLMLNRLMCAAIIGLWLLIVAVAYAACVALGLAFR